MTPRIRPGQWYRRGQSCVDTSSYQVLVISVTRDHVTYLLFNHQTLADRVIRTPRRDFNAWFQRSRRIA